MRLPLPFTLTMLAACSATPAARTGPATPSAPSPLPAVAISAIGEDVVTSTNAQRRTHSLPALKRSTALMQAAQLHAEQMAAAQKMSHVLTGARYPEPVDRLNAVAYNWGASGENVAEGYSDAQAAVAGWMKSTGHRENILSTRFTEMGAGAAKGTNGRVYYVQVFGTPR